MKLAEEMLRAGAQIGVIDPVGVWRALRVPHEKGGQAFDVVVFGGLYGDLPLKDTAGELVADLVIDRGISFVLDVSQFIPAEQQRFVRAFADRFFHRKKAAPSAVHLFLEECQEFIPENPSGDEARTLGVMQRLWKLGRNFGIGGSLISQRPQEISKKALNMSGTLFAFQMTGPQERKAIRAWVADQGVAVDIEGVLQKLTVGQPHVESPTFLQLSRTVHILPRVTADLSSTPKVGIDAAAKRALTPIDVKKLEAAMIATIEEQKANDPRELKRQIAALKAELSKAGQIAPARTTSVEKPILTDADRALLEKVAAQIAETQRLLSVNTAFDRDELLKEINRCVAEYLHDVTNEHDDARRTFLELFEKKSVQKLFEKLTAFAGRPGATSGAVSPNRSSTRPVTTNARGTGVPPASGNRPPPSGPAAEDLRLATSKGMKKHVVAILTALAQHPDGRTREQTLILAGYQPSGDISTAFAGLLEHGWIEDGGGRLRITAGGLTALGPYDPLPSGRALRELILAKSTSAERKLLTALFDTYDAPARRAELHERSGLKPSGDTSTALAKFLKLGWAVERDGGLVAADTFFED